MVKIDNQWYYSIDDLFDIVNIQKHDQFIGTLQANPELNPKWSQITRSISYQDETGNHTSLFVTKTGAIAIMPHLEQKFPGPFIRWLDRVDKLNRVEVSTKTEPVAYASPPTTG